MTGALTVLGPMEAAQLPTSLLPLISFETGFIQGSDGQFDGTSVTGCKIAKGAPEALIREGLAAIHRQCQPCGADFALTQLRLLKARTKARPDADQTLTAAAYGDWLAEYPQDVAKAACEEWARGMVFWPAWADLQRICDRLVSKRVAVRRALQAALETPERKLYLGKPAPESREQRLAGTIAAYLKHGQVNRAAKREKELAAEQGREPEAWARVEMPEPVAAKIALPSLPPISPDVEAATWRDAAKFHRSQGRAKYAEILERRADNLMPPRLGDAHSEATPIAEAAE